MVDDCIGHRCSAAEYEQLEPLTAEFLAMHSELARTAITLDLELLDITIECK